jgi:anti-sigma factor RsiW
MGVRGLRFQLDHLLTARRLSAFQDDELAPRERARVAGHLAECDDCAHAARTLARTLAALPGVRRRPPRLAARVIGRLRAQDPPTRR